MKLTLNNNCRKQEGNVEMKQGPAKLTALFAREIENNTYSPI